MKWDKNILFIANGGKEWIGGLYYIKNIIYTLFKTNKITDKTKVYIVVKEENVEVFESLNKYENVEIIIYKNSLLNKVLNKIGRKLTNKPLDTELLFLVKKLKIDYLYPVVTFPYLFLEDKCVYWIPDFQHLHLPEMFSEIELNKINKTFEYIAKNHKKLILSSQDALRDYEALYPDFTKGVEVIGFESFIEDDLRGVDKEFTQETVKKYDLPKDFIFLPNQFWKHKNHITAFKAINYLATEKQKNICLVCTGNTEDYRNKEHFSYLLKFIKENKLQANIKILGFISRKEQLALMKASKTVLQPSLCEGWGTVVEDAKALDKNIIMSDISVHFEQKNKKSMIFEKENFKELGDIINN